MRFETVLVIAALVASSAHGHETRAEEIQAARDLKATSLAPERPSKVEQYLIRFKENKILERWSAGYHGLTTHLGGLPNGSGLALGTRYVRTQGKLTLDADATISSASWTRFEAGLSKAAKKTGEWVFDLRGVRRDYRTLSSPHPDYDYRLQDSTFDALAGIRVQKHLTVGGSAGFETATMRREDQPVRAQGDSARMGAFAEYDTRNRAENSRNGRLLVARFDNYRATANSLYNFRRATFEAQQYIPFLNERRVVVLRARTVQTFTRDGNSVPLYQQSVLGGSDDLRGYRPYSFQGDNLVLMNAEYRWEVFSGLDMAVFGDMGQVSAERWDVKRLEKSAGFGFRFNAHNVTFLRIDTGFSSDGVQVFLRFNNIFRTRRLNSSTAAHIL